LVVILGDSLRPFIEHLVHLKSIGLDCDLERLHTERTANIKISVSLYSRCLMKHTKRINCIADAVILPLYPHLHVTTNNSTALEIRTMLLTHVSGNATRCKKPEGLQAEMKISFLFIYIQGVVIRRREYIVACTTQNALHIETIVSKTSRPRLHLFTCQITDCTGLNFIVGTRQHSSLCRIIIIVLYK
jgi:hypothetical protein